MANPWEEDYTVEAEPQEETSLLPWEEDYGEEEYKDAGSFSAWDYVGATRAEESEWDNFWHAFSKVKSISEAAGDVMEQHIPLGRIQITDPETGDIDIQYIPPSEELKTAVRDGDEELASAILSFERENRLQQRFSELYTDEGLQKEDTENIWGSILGAVADPTTLVPFAAGWRGAALSGAAFGGVDSTLLALADKGEVDFGDVAIGAALGAVIPTGLKGAGKAFGLHQWQDSAAAAGKVLDRYDKKVLENVARGIPLDMAQYNAAARAGIKGGYPEVVKAVEKAGRIPTMYKGMTPAGAIDALEQIELAASGGFLNRFGFLKPAGEFADKYLGSVSTRIKSISPRIFHAMRKADLDTHLAVHGLTERVMPWSAHVTRLMKDDRGTYNRLKKALMGEDFKTAYGLIGRLEGTNPAYKGMHASFKETRKVLDEIFEDAKAVGYDVDKVKFYFPKLVKNKEGLGVVRKSVIAQRLAEKARKQGRELTQEERRYEIERIIMGHHKQAAKTATNMRQRQYHFMLDDMLPHYAELNDSLHGYIRHMVHDVQRRKFLLAHSTKKGKKAIKEKADIRGYDLEDSISSVVEREVNRLKLTDRPEAADTLTKLLTARFGMGERGATPAIQSFKNVTYGLTLGNIMSAATQLGDNAFGIFLNGLRPHLRAVGQTLPGGERLVKKTDIGLSEISDEILNDPTKSKKFLDWTLRWSGFSAIDKFGKENLLNGALMKAQKLVKTEKGRSQFIAKWGPYFEGDTYGLLKKIERGQFDDDNVRLFLWHSLSDAQPIGLSEMPEAYLNHPNGRVFYMLKSFTIKQFDLMRREIFQDFADGNTARAANKLATFITLFALINGGSDTLKDVMSGKEIDMSDTAVDNLAKLVGLSRYQTAKFSKDGPLHVISQTLLPPFPLDKPYQAIATGRPEKLLEPVPIAGRAAAGWLKE